MEDKELYPYLEAAIKALADGVLTKEFIADAVLAIEGKHNLNKLFAACDFEEILEQYLKEEEEEEE